MTKRANMKPQDLGLLSIPLIGGGIKQVAVNTIHYLRSDDTITYIYFDEEASKIISAKNLGHFERELSGKPFMRIHKSLIVNLARITEFRKADNSLLLESGAAIHVSREQKPRLMEYLQRKGDKDEDVVARLMVNSPSQVFKLWARDYMVGRKSLSKPCDIMIVTEDKTMSRNHFKIFTNKRGSNIDFTVSIADPSNDTLLDGVMMATGELYPLLDGAIIRAGATDIVFRTVVQEMDDFEKTVFHPRE